MAQEIAENADGDAQENRPSSCLVGLLATVLALVVLLNIHHMPPLLGMFLLFVLLRAAWRGFNSIPDLLAADLHSRMPDPTDVPEGEQHRRR